MKVERKTRKLLLAKTTLRWLSPYQLKVVAGADGTTSDTQGAQDSYRGCGVEDPTTH